MMVVAPCKQHPSSHDANSVHTCMPRKKQQQGVSERQHRQHRVQDCRTCKLPGQTYCKKANAAQHTPRTFQGMMVVKPGRTTTLPEAVNVSPPPASTAFVFFSTQSPAAARRAECTSVAAQQPACLEIPMQMPRCTSASQSEAAEAVGPCCSCRTTL
jgi:hypothetical protein